MPEKKYPHITLLSIVNEIRRLAAESPTFTYHLPRCVYVEKVGPNSYCKSCIVGHALVNLGVDPKDLYVEPKADFEIVNAIPAASMLLIELGIWDGNQRVRKGDLAAKANNRRVLWIGHVQIQQDGRVAWGDAVKEADIADEYVDRRVNA